MITPATQDSLGDEVLERGMERLQLDGAGPGESPEPQAFSSERPQSPIIQAVPPTHVARVRRSPRAPLTLPGSSHTAAVPIDLDDELVFCVFSGYRHRL